MADAAQESAGESTEPHYLVSSLSHVVIRVDTEDELQRALEVLTGLGLDPVRQWSTIRQASFEVNTPDSARVRALLGQTNLAWLLVEPGQPDYLLRTLTMQVPDGRRVQLSDTPAATTVADLAGGVQQFLGGGDGMTVVDHVQPGGRRRRMRPNETLHQAGVRDGDEFIMARQARAGVINPMDRRDALYRVRNQMLDFDDAHPEFTIELDSNVLPTAYLLQFDQDSFGPPADPGTEPPAIRRHQVEIALGQHFPEQGPDVTWLTPIFHPNIFPSYDCPPVEERPWMRGRVCLGMLRESYTPGLNFEELCQMLIDMAGYRNYSLLEQSQEDLAGRVNLHVNWFNEAAAIWAAQDLAQQRIKEIGGIELAQALPLVFRRGVAGSPNRYRNLVIEVDKP